MRANYQNSQAYVLENIISTINPSPSCLSAGKSLGIKTLARLGFYTASAFSQLINARARVFIVRITERGAAVEKSVCMADWNDTTSSDNHINMGTTLQPLLPAQLTPVGTTQEQDTSSRSPRAIHFGSPLTCQCDQTQQLLGHSPMGMSGPAAAWWSHFRRQCWRMPLPSKASRPSRSRSTSI